MTSTSHDQILQQLRQGQRPFPTAQPPTSYRPMVPDAALEPTALQARFVQEAETAGCELHVVADAAAAAAVVLRLIGQDTAVSTWEFSQIPLPGLAEALAEANVARREQDATMRVGITGVDAALAVTGSLVVMSGNGRYRAASLLPPVHIAVVKAGQIVPDLETWWAQQRRQGLEQMRQSSNVVVITGPSRTADIAMQLVMGMHGPRDLHVILLP